MNVKHHFAILPFITVFFFTHAFQTFDASTGTLYIYSSSDFTTTYQNSTKHVIIVSGVSQIPQRAFYLWTSLTSASIRNSVTSIEYYAFAYCTSLSCITIPSSVTSIGQNVFTDCSALATVVLEEGLQTIGTY